jgi:hypothetical protein
MCTPLPIRHHLLIGLALTAIAVTAYFYLTQSAPRTAEPAAQRPVHLAAMDPVPDLPAYLLKLCGPEVIESHGGMTAEGGLPPWFLQAAEILAAKGLKWPAPAVGIDDPILKSNVFEHETRHAPMLATDPEAAVRLLEPLIRYEEEKYLARSWRAALENSAASNNGSADPEVYRNMLAGLPGRYFSRMIGETLERHPDPVLAAIAISESKRRRPEERLAGLAAVIGNRELDFATRESAARTLAPELHVTFDSAQVDGIDWAFEVSERLRNNAD